MTSGTVGRLGLSSIPRVGVQRLESASHTASHARSHFCPRTTSGRASAAVPGGRWGAVGKVTPLPVVAEWQLAPRRRAARRRQGAWPPRVQLEHWTDPDGRRPRSGDAHRRCAGTGRSWRPPPVVRDTVRAGSNRAGPAPSATLAQHGDPSDDQSQRPATGTAPLPKPQLHRRRCHAAVPPYHPLRTLLVTTRLSPGGSAQRCYGMIGKSLTILTYLEALTKLSDDVSSLRRSARR
jgi:hypothetical protein